MAHAGQKVEVRLDPGRPFQTIDGFGMNFNTKYWHGEGERLKPALDLLIDDLGARLFRVDIWGKSDWVDPTGQMGPASLSESCQAEVYGGEIFRRGWAVMRYLNAKGIQPYLTASGDVPAWMLGPDGKTLSDYESFTEILVSMLDWAVRREKINLRWFGPLNETDLGSPEGPLVSPVEYVRVCELLDEKLARRGLDHIRLVVPEAAQFNPNYVRELVKSEKLRERIEVFSMHTYSDLTEAAYREVTETVAQSPYAGTRLWLGEFGDLEQTGEKEWYVAWAMLSRLMTSLEAGFQGALAWDAYDNLHDHDGWWTIYGLLRTGLRAFTPKKRYYALKHLYRFVPPGFERVALECDTPDVRALAFSSPDRGAVSVVGMNLSSSRSYYLNVTLPGFPAGLRAGRVNYYRTSETENCALVANLPATGGNWPFTGIEALLPPDSIFTLTSL